jgi:hypothetical protein
MAYVPHPSILGIFEQLKNTPSGVLKNIEKRKGGKF